MLQKCRQVVREYFVGKSLLRKIVTLDSLGYTGLQSTLYRISSQIVCTAVLFCLEENLGLADSRVRQLLQVGSIHLDLFYARLRYAPSAVSPRVSRFSTVCSKASSMK